MAEIEALGPSAWQSHPKGLRDHSAIPLVAANGDRDLTILQGLFQPTVPLKSLPACLQIMRSFGTVTGRSMIVRVNGNTTAPMTLDIGFHWARRFRIVIPLTAPASDFIWKSAGRSRYIPNGEAWLINGWDGFRYENSSEEPVSFLTIETTGSPSFCSIVSKSERPYDQKRDIGPTRRKLSLAASAEPLVTERIEKSTLVSPWLVESMAAEMLDWLSTCCPETHRHYLPQLRAVLGNFVHRWHQAFSIYGQDDSGTKAYQKALDELIAQSARFSGSITLPNGLDPAELIYRSFVVGAIRSKAHVADQFITPDLKRVLRAEISRRTSPERGGSEEGHSGRKSKSSELRAEVKTEPEFLNRRQSASGIQSANRSEMTAEVPIHDRESKKSIEPDKRSPSSDPGQFHADKLVRDNGLSAILDELAVSLIISTYQFNKIISINVSNGNLVLKAQNAKRPMGVCVADNRLAVGSSNQVELYLEDNKRACERSTTLRADRNFLLHSAHITGAIDVHELAWAGDELWFVNTRFSCLCTLDEECNFVPRWKPKFISKYGPEDRCHLNGLAVVNDEVRYATALGNTDIAGGWRDGRASGGVLIDTHRDEIVCSGLSMPHSPRWHLNRLWVLDSGRGALCFVDEKAGILETVSELPGFTRGLDFYGSYAFVGLSQVRESAVFSGIPLADRMQQLICGIGVVDIATGELVGSLVFKEAAEEIFSVVVVPNASVVTLFGADDPETATNYRIPG